MSFLIAKSTPSAVTKDSLFSSKILEWVIKKITHVNLLIYRIEDTKNFVIAKSTRIR